MIGNEPTIRDISLDLAEVVLPVNLLSGETIPAEEVELRPEPERFRVDSICGACRHPVRLCIQVSSRTVVRNLEELLLNGLDILCVTCYKEGSRNGGR
nr:MAG: E7 protein [Hydrurga leptonyx papillomavirus 3]